MLHKNGIDYKYNINRERIPKVNAVFRGLPQEYPGAPIKIVLDWNSARGLRTLSSTRINSNLTTTSK